MSNFINIYSSITEYNADETKQYPNVSYLETEDIVKWQATEPIDQEHVVAKYNVTDTTGATKILNNTSNITAMIVDGVQVSPSIEYNFSTTGAHTVKYKINSSWDSLNAFNRCYSLTSINIPTGVTSIGDESFNNCSGLTSVSIPSGVTSIGSSAFYGCSGLTSVTIPDSVTSIGSSAFRFCSSLTSVTIPDSVTSIGSSAFGQSSGLTNVTIGSGVNSIGGGGFYIGAFQYCSGLTSVTVKATTPPTMNSGVFSNTNNTFIIYVPSASVNTYKAASGWSTYASRIQAIQ